jgi:deoxyribose-phosphate aldolase
MPTITTSLGGIAKLIDHSLLHPTMTDDEVEAGLEISKKYNVGAACIKPYSIPAARRVLAGTDVLICSVIGFPHGNSTTAMKVTEAREAVLAGAHEIDMVVNVGKVLGGDWDYVREEIKAINDVVTGTRVGYDERGRTAVLKVIFENDYLKDEHIIRLCQICAEVGVAFIKTSTGYGFVKQENGMYSYKGATIPQLKLMKENSGPEIKIKAAGGVRTLDEFLYVMWLGVSRVGATATVAVMEEARRRGIADQAVEVEVPELKPGQLGGTY